MMSRYVTLAQRIQLEFEEIERTQAAILRHWQAALVATTDQDAYLNSVALNLHSWYSGIERIFELIATEIDGGPLGGEAWHSELVRQMTLDIPETRPPVIERNIALQLEEYRKFRHRIRNIYATSLDSIRVQPLVNGLPELWLSLKQDLTRFVDFLNALARNE